MDKFVFDKETRQALADGVARNDNIADMEYIGLPPKITGLLNRANIVKLSDLLCLSYRELLEVDSIAKKTVEIIYETLMSYRLMDRELEKRKQKEIDKKIRIKSYRKYQLFYEA